MRVISQKHWSGNSRTQWYAYAVFLSHLGPSSPLSTSPASESLCASIMIIDLGLGNFCCLFHTFTFFLTYFLVTINSPSFDYATLPHLIQLVFSRLFAFSFLLLPSFLKPIPHSLIYSTRSLVTINHYLLNVTIPIQVMRILYRTS